MARVLDRDLRLTPWVAFIALAGLCVGARAGADVHELPADFQLGLDGWEAGFSDFPVGEEDDFDLVAGHAAVPPPLAEESGFYLSGDNHSDDLFMFVTKRFGGLAPMSHYELSFEVSFATNAPRGCSGVGGAPGESVAIKAGASAVEPVPVDTGGTYRMNVDKGEQAQGGAAALVIGDFASSQECGAGEPQYEVKTLDSQGTSFRAATNASGELWLLLGTDSGYESVTGIYFLEARATAVPEPRTSHHGPALLVAVAGLRRRVGRRVAGAAVGVPCGPPPHRVRGDHGRRARARSRPAA